ncbi:MAG: RagB/SusD family nutrient uptake outer membrane protein [Bacteroidales bacterium]|nr:RagB/SusD family nutrient uptake outer membrane protein [Bacteroidales bacterium]
MKRFVSYILIGVAALGLTACNGFLDKAPVLSQSTEITLSDYAGLNKATAGAYDYLANSGWYGGERVLESEMRGGNGIKNADHNSNRYTTQMNWNYTADATSNLWAYGFITVSRCNNVIDNLEGKAIDGVTEQDLNNLKAECLFLRALSHFDMVTLYALPYNYVKANQASLSAAQKAGIPYVYHTDPDARPERLDVLTVYQNIVEDLLEAEKIIGADYVRADITDTKAAVTLPAIQALLSRVYLYMSEWQKSADYATKVIKNKAYKLYTADEYTETWTGKTGGSEVIFEAYIDLTNYSNLNCSYMTYPEGAYGDCVASPALVDLYDESDVRGKLYGQDKKETAGVFWTLKYAGKGLSTPDANNTVILRLSEMYLNRAEAIVNGASVADTDALQDLNTIRSNRGVSALTSAGMEAVRSERRMELAWEGHIFFDMARWGLPVNRASCFGLQEKNQNIPFPDYRWALPIAKRELEVNENLVQNEKY